ncbi:Type II secretion system protein F [Pirellulimonas nuda]|uniref:Type II secretion system protein F n=1 Tax=Pirellulimonas nuda TaxID=2528009 RepID=A0A518DI03_9BACT|nr:type II secretion system F family protein [Pirellulimonas nuda]QDU91106.1 Type II secretion system protein F [Pirellulimonas nuda]
MLDQTAAYEPQVSTESVAERIALWTEARVPLPEALDAIAEDLPPADRRALAAVAQRLRQGEGLAEAVADSGREMPRRLRRTLQAIAACAPRGADLAAALPAVVSQQATFRQRRRRLWAALAYPTLLLSGLWALIVFLAVFVAPGFQEVYDEFDLELPNMTVFALAAARQVAPITLVALLVVFALVAACRAQATARVVHWLATGLPLVGGAVVDASHLEFSALTAALLHARTPLPDALRAAASGLADRSVARATGRLAQRVEEGETLSGAMDQSLHFERGLAAQVRWGESEGDVAAALDNAAEQYSRRLDYACVFLRRTASPVMVVAFVCLVGILALAFVLPLIKLIEGLT